MKINEVIINEGVLDNIRNSSFGKYAQNTAKKIGKGKLWPELGKVGGAIKAIPNVYNSVKNLPASIPSAAKQIFSNPSKSMVGQQQEIKKNFIKIFDQRLRKQIAANNVAQVPFNLTTFINKMADQEGLDLTHSAYANKITPAIKAVEDSKYKQQAVNLLGSLMYSAAVAAQSGATSQPTQTQQTTQAQIQQPQIRRPFKPGGTVSRIR